MEMRLIVTSLSPCTRSIIRRIFSSSVALRPNSGLMLVFPTAKSRNDSPCSARLFTASASGCI